jgi:hypothetical protein
MSLVREAGTSGIRTPCRPRRTNAESTVCYGPPDSASGRRRGARGVLRAFSSARGSGARIRSGWALRPVAAVAGCPPGAGSRRRGRCWGRWATGQGVLRGGSSDPPPSARAARRAALACAPSASRSPEAGTSRPRGNRDLDHRIRGSCSLSPRPPIVPRTRRAAVAIAPAITRRIAQDR